MLTEWEVACFSYHKAGDMNCNKGWCGDGNFPMECPCGGLIHSVSLGHDDGCPVYDFLCDKCRLSYYDKIEYDRSKKRFIFIKQ